MSEKESLFFSALSQASDCVEALASINDTVYASKYFITCLDFMTTYYNYKDCIENVKWAQDKVFKLAYLHPNPYSLTFKMTARTVHTASKLAVWAAASETTAKADQAAKETAREVEMLARWTRTSVDIKTCPQVYEPAEDSFLLADAARAEIKYSEIGRTLEIGCGTGIISVLIHTWVNAVDINPHAVKCARQNGIDAIKSDLFEKVTANYDLIIFNPPYLPDSEDEKTGDMIDKALFGGLTGREVIDRFFDGVRDHLSNSGKILMVISNETGIEEVKHKAESLGYIVTEVDHFQKLKVLKFRHRHPAKATGSMTTITDG